MEMIDDDNDFWENRTEAERRLQERITNHKNIYSCFKAGKLANIVPLWHTKANEIDLSKQNEKLTKETLSHGYSVIEDIDIEFLFDNMQSGNPELFRGKKLYEKRFDCLKTSEILNYWLNGTKLIPPTILLIKETNQLFPVDGKHRLNAAYYFGATKIPIFVLNNELEKIKSILKLD